MKRRVVVTGMGAITPIGLGVEEFGTLAKRENVALDQLHIMIQQILRQSLLHR